MTIGEKIVKLRKEAGWSQETFSEKLNISRQAVSKWENGTAQPTNENLSQIAKLFDVTISSLLDDDDITMGSIADMPQQEIIDNKNEIKAGKITGIIHSVAIIILGIAVIATSIANANLRNELSTLRSNFSSLEARVSSLVSSLQYNINNNPQRQTTSQFTDYSYNILNYDRDTNTALLQFKFVPADFTRDTQAKIVLKDHNEQTYTADAVWENDIFTAQVEVNCNTGFIAYLYLTENGATRSSVIDHITNPNFNFMMRIYADTMEGDIARPDGELKMDTRIGCGIEYVIADEANTEFKSIYPVKATIEIYSGGQFITSYPFESMNEYDFLNSQDYVNHTEYAPDNVDDLVHLECVFYSYIKDTVADERFKRGVPVDFVITVVDNHGNEHTDSIQVFDSGH